jgi:hypothetical protein
MVETSDAEIETQRLEIIEERREDKEQGWLDEAAPGTMYAHEALHMTAFLQNSFDTEVMHHPTVLRDPELYRLAFRAFERMYEVYQAIGAQYLNEE